MTSNWLIRNNSDVESLLYEEFRRYEIEYPTRGIASTRFTRWGKNRRYWAVKCGDGYAFGDYVTGLSKKVFPNKQYIKEDWEKRKQATASFDAKRAEERAESARKANEIWKLSAPITEEIEFPYLHKKQIKSFGLRCTTGANVKIVIPLMDIEHNISTLQFIDSIGNKRFLKNGIKGGCFYPIGEFKDCNGKILLCEGYATGASIYMATEELTICCFDAGNLLHVSVNIKKLYPNAEIIICADNDKSNEEATGRNPGLEAGKEVANAIHAVVVYPIFKNPKDKSSDFNDLHCREGIDTVREQISGAYGVRYG